MMNDNFRILIVDDEKNIREGLSNEIDWQIHGCDVVGLAEDGEMALDIAKHTKPHIIITDINMPFVNGLDLCQQIREILPDIELIVLTGYDEFTYAKKSIELDVVDFLLKPVSERKLIEAIEKAIVRINEHEKLQQANKMERRLEEYMPIIRNRFFEQLMRGLIQPEELNSKTEFYELYTDEYYTVLIVDFNYHNRSDSDSERNLQLVSIDVHDAFSNLGNRFSQKSVIWESLNKLTFLIGTKNRSDTGDALFETIYEFKEMLTEKHEICISIGVSNPHLGAKNIPIAYQESENALRYCYMIDRDIIVFSQQINNPSESMDTISLMAEYEIFKSMQAGDKQKVTSLMENLHDQISEKMKNKVVHFRTIYNHILISAFRIAQECASYQVDDDKEIDQFDMQIDNIKSLDDIHKMVLDTLLKFCDIIRKSNACQYSKVIDMAIQYGKEHIKDSLSLTEIAGIVHLSSSYFSYIFKKETGQNWSAYLTQLRMEKAKELLRVQHFKLYEIAERVGYNEASYFSNQFKKLVGCSPSEYRDDQLYYQKSE